MAISKLVRLFCLYKIRLVPKTWHQDRLSKSPDSGSSGSREMVYGGTWRVVNKLLEACYEAIWIGPNCVERS